MNKHIKKLKISAFVLFTMSLQAIVFGTAAQQSGEPGNSGPTPGAATAVPIDGGASLLAAAGISYGLKRLRKHRKAAADKL